MSQEMNKVAREPDLKALLLKAALAPNPGTPEELDALPALRTTSATASWSASSTCAWTDPGLSPLPMLLQHGERVG
jgi:hypothetical protein